MSTQPSQSLSKRTDGPSSAPTPTSSTASSTASTSGRTGQLPAAVDWDWRWVLGKRAGRRPAIKHPSRHQWYYCNPNYDATLKPPKKLLSPFAPPTAQYVDDWAAYQRTKPTSDPQQVWRHRREFIEHLKLREGDWRAAFQQGLAAEVKAAKKRERLEREAARQLAWRQYRDALFEASAGKVQ